MLDHTVTPTPVPPKLDSRRPVADYELVDHGVDHEQYFQGCGTAFTSYTDVATGAGSDPREALEDALDQLACVGWDAEALERRILSDLKRKAMPTRPRAKHEDHYYYLSLRVKGGAA